MTSTDTNQITEPVDVKALLMGRREATTEEVQLPSLGVSVTVRGLTRREALTVTGKPMPAEEAERKLLAMAMVSPPMTEDEVRTWQRNAPAGELQPIDAAIKRLSGMGETAVKDEMATFPE